MWKPNLFVNNPHRNVWGKGDVLRSSLLGCCLHIKKPSLANACFLLSPVHGYLYKLVRTSGWTPGRLRCCCILTMWVQAPAGTDRHPLSPTWTLLAWFQSQSRVNSNISGWLSAELRLWPFLAVVSFVALRLFPNCLLTAVGQLDFSQRLNLTNRFVYVRGAILLIPNTSHNVTLNYFSISSILKWH